MADSFRSDLFPRRGGVWGETGMEPALFPRVVEVVASRVISIVELTGDIEQVSRFVHQIKQEVEHINPAVNHVLDRAVK